jgi:hypothetical protein
MAQFLVNVVGLPNVPTVREINVRAAPTTTAALIIRLPIGTRGLVVVDAQPDSAGTRMNGKLYQWLKVRLPAGGDGWMRDDLVEVEGDGTPFGYPVLLVPAIAFSLTRRIAAAAGFTPLTGAVPPAPPPRPPVPSSPVAPPPPPPPPVVVAPPPPPVQPPPSGEPRGKVIGKGGVNLRAAPVNGAVLTRLNFGDSVKILNAQAQGGTSNYKWVRVQTASGSDGFVRDDFLSISGDASAFGLSKGDEYPAPMVKYGWVRGFNVNQNPGEPEHLGWDFGADTGEPMLAAPNGGTVTRVLLCRKCTPDKPSTLMHGFSLGDTSIFSDEGWGFGYGTFVIVRYDNHLLPASTRDRLTARGLSGAALFALYGHLAAATVMTGQTVTGGQQIGTCGNTGNSQAPHLHLEVRASTNPNAQWGNIRNGLLDPGVLFLR